MTSRVHDSSQALKRAGQVWFNHVKIKKLGRMLGRKKKKKKKNGMELPEMVAVHVLLWARTCRPVGMN